MYITTLQAFVIPHWCCMLSCQRPESDITCTRCPFQLLFTLGWWIIIVTGQAMGYYSLLHALFTKSFLNNGCSPHKKNNLPRPITVMSILTTWNICERLLLWMSWKVRAKLDTSFGQQPLFTKDSLVITWICVWFATASSSGYDLLHPPSINRGT